MSQAKQARIGETEQPHVRCCYEQANLVFSSHSFESGSVHCLAFIFQLSLDFIAVFIHTLQDSNVCEDIVLSSSCLSDKCP